MQKACDALSKLQIVTLFVLCFAKLYCFHLSNRCLLKYNNVFAKIFWFVDLWQHSHKTNKSLQLVSNFCPVSTTELQQQTKVRN